MIVSKHVRATIHLGTSERGQKRRAAMDEMARDDSGVGPMIAKMADEHIEKLTEYQKAQLLHLHTTGEFKYRNAKGNKVSRRAWTKMIRALHRGGLIDEKCKPTRTAIEWLNENHMSISFDVLN